MIEGWKFLKVWERVVGPKLAKAGYKRAGDVAIRTKGKAKQMVALERDARQGGRFTIVYAVAHDFCRSFKDGKPLKLAAPQEAVFLARLGMLMEGKEVWWPYGDTEDACEKVLAALSDVALAYADAWFETLADPGTAYIALKKAEANPGRETCWNLALYAKALGHADEANEWLERISDAPAHVAQLKQKWAAAG